MPRSDSTYGAPMKMNRKHGVKVTHVVRQAEQRCPPGMRRQCARGSERRHEADELQHHDQGPGGGLGHSETIEHLAGISQCSALRRAGDIGEHGIGAAESNDSQFAEECPRSRVRRVEPPQ